MNKRQLLKERHIQPKRREGVYGGETNGANPPKWSLLDTICAQLRGIGYHVECGELSDGSGDWLQVYKKILTAPGKQVCMVISFKHGGEIITGIKVYEETILLKMSEDSKIIF